MQTFPERDIVFSFPDESDGWSVCRYESTELHIQKMMPLQKTHAIDFICHNDGKIIFLEVKRYKEKAFSDAGNDIDVFFTELCAQFRDTICGLAVSRICSDSELAVFSDALLTMPKDDTHTVALFLEIENLPIMQKQKILANILSKLRTRFVPMGFAVRVLDSSSPSEHCPWQVEVR